MKKIKIIGIALILSASSLYAQNANAILDQTGVNGGLVVHLGCKDAQLTAGLYGGPSFLVHALDRDASNVEKAREVISQAGIYGPVSATVLTGDRLPYPDHIVKLLVVSDDLGIAEAEMKRVLCPQGRLVTLDTRHSTLDTFIKPRPAEMDEWTHYLHGPNNNPVSDDELVAPPTKLIWMTEPMYYRSHSWNKSIVGLVTANGRTYHIEDRGPIGTLDVRFPERWFVVCRDAFSGIELWTVPLGPAWGQREWEEMLGQGGQSISNVKGVSFSLWTMPLSCNRRIVVDPKRDQLFVTLEYRAPIKAIDAKTGKILKTFDQAGDVDELVQAEDGTLILRARDIPKRETKFGYTGKDAPAKFMAGFFPEKSDRVVAMNPDTGDVLWKTAPGHLAPMTLCAHNGRVAFFNYKELVCLNQKTGNELWRVPVAPNIRTFKTDTPYFALRGAGGVMMHGDKVFIAASKGTHAYDAATGEKRWEARGGSSGACFEVPATPYLANGALWSVGRRGAFGIDPETGQQTVSRDIGNMIYRGHHVRCHLSKATQHYYINNERGAEFIDLRGDNHQVHDWIHGGCGHGVVPANGLLYDPPDPCQCYKGVKVPGLKAMAGGEVDLSVANAQRLVKGSAFERSTKLATKIATKTGADWPMYRHDPGRSGYSSVPGPTAPAVRWKVNLDGKGTQPVIADGRVYVAVSERHRVDCYSEADGKKLWSFIADGPVDLPPTVAGGRVYFGGMDGKVYCLDAANGALCWSYRVAPRDQRIQICGQLQSSWPVHGSVMVIDGKVYATAGVSTYLDGGIFAVALDAQTGKLLHETRLDGPRATLEELKKGVDKKTHGSGLIMEGSNNDIFTYAGDRMFMLFQVFDKELNLVKIPPAGRAGQRDLGVRHLIPNGGYTDTSLFNREYWSYSRYWWYPGENTTGNWIVFDDQNFYAVDIYNMPIGYGAHKQYTWVDIEKPYRIHANSKTAPEPDPFEQPYPYDETKNLWSADLLVVPRGVAQAGPNLYIIGIPSAGLTPEQAMDAALDIGQAQLQVISTDGGQKIAECDVPATCVFDGISAANGKIFASLVNGEMVCIGSE